MHWLDSLVLNSCTSFFSLVCEDMQHEVSRSAKLTRMQTTSVDELLASNTTSLLAMRNASYSANKRTLDEIVTVTT